MAVVYAVAAMNRCCKGQDKGLTRILACTVLMIAAAWSLPAGDEVFSITKEQALRNRYVIVIRNYPSSALYYSAGEVDVHHGAMRTGIPLYDSSGVIVSRTFTPTIGSELSLYHEVRFTITRSGGTICTNAPTESVPFPTEWVAIVGDITDTLVLRLFVESFEGGPEPHVVDSVAIYPNPTSECVEHEGTSLCTSIHRQTIPASFSGKLCRLRIEIDRQFRFGPEVEITFFPSNIALSAGHIPSGLSTWSPEQSDSLHKRYNLFAEEFIRKELRYTNSMQGFNHVLIDAVLHAKIMSDYFYMVPVDGRPDAHSLYPKRNLPGTARVKEPLPVGGSRNFISYSQDYQFGISSTGEDSIIGKVPQLASATPQALEIRYGEVHVKRGQMRITIRIPPNVQKLSWRVADMDGIELKRGMVKTRFKAHVPITIPYIPPSGSAHVLTLVDESNGTEQSQVIEKY